MRRSPETVYRGERTAKGVVVTVDGKPLSAGPSRLVADLSEGFEWGYRGAGSGLLALALVLDATDDPILARESYRWFRWAKVGLFGKRWQMTAGEVFAWLDRFDTERGATADKPALVAAGKGGAR